jgi:hypothetical protein
MKPDRMKEGMDTMKTRLPLLLLTVTLAGLLVGCAAGGTKSNPFSQNRSEQEVKFFITNLAFGDATIHSITNGARRRLGMANGKREVVFTLPMRFPSEVALEIDFIAGPKCYTERMTVDPGDHLELIIQPSLDYLQCGEAESPAPQ